MTPLLGPALPYSRCRVYLLEYPIFPRIIICICLSRILSLPHTHSHPLFSFSRRVTLAPVPLIVLPNIPSPYISYLLFLFIPPPSPLSHSYTIATLGRLALLCHSTNQHLTSRVVVAAPVALHVTPTPTHPSTPGKVTKIKQKIKKVKLQSIILFFF